MPSHHGWAVVAGAGGALLAGRTFGIVELYVVGAGLLALVLIGVALTLLRPASLTVERIVEPARPEVGDEARVQLVVRSAGSTPAIELWEPVAGAGGASMRLAPLRRGESAAATYRLPTARRGLVQVGPLSGELGDPFGLSHRTLWLAPEREVLVYPRAVPVPLPQLGAGTGPLSRFLARRAVGHPSADEFRSLRDYVPGDDLRRVNWKASARRDGLVVRESDPAAALHLTVVLDLHAGLYSTEGFERAVAATASLVVSAVQLDKAMRLITTDSQEHTVDATHLDEVLHHLALVTPSAGRTPPAGRTHDDGLHVVIVVTGGIEAGRLGLLRVAGGAADAGVVVACDAGGDPPGGWFCVRSLGTPEGFAEQWDELVGRLGGPAAAARDARERAARPTPVGRR